MIKTTAIKTKWSENDYAQNTYVVTDDKTAIIIDAGADVAKIKQMLNGVSPSAVFITHCHFDHIAHIEDYCAEFDCPIFLSDEGERFLTDENLNVSAGFECNKTYHLPKFEKLGGGEELSFGALMVKVVKTPGHTADGLCFVVRTKTSKKGNAIVGKNIDPQNFKDKSSENVYYSSPDEPIIFSGDTFFCRAIGRTDLPTGNEADMIKSLTTILSLDFSLAFAGHARVSTRAEQEHNISVWLRRLKSTQ